MCGICGKLMFDREVNVSPALVKTMADTIGHRGPDDEGYYLSGPIGLGFRRLSIIDLSTGHQPISNEDGSIWVVFNGEIYNYAQLRSELLAKGHVFKTQTDTEVLVHLYEEYGPELLEELRGMFAFALWDEKKRTLLLARDRVGIKPLYYWLTATSLLFASEVKAILADPSVKAGTDPVAVDHFMTYLYGSGERTIFKGVSKLLPGHYMVVKDGEPRIRQYWDLSFPASRSTKSMGESADELSELLARSVSDHMIADVPVGILLSGGVDSTAMLSYAIEQTNKQTSTFTIGFDDQQCTDERPYARIAAQKYGTKHYEMTITAKDFLDCLPLYVWHMEEPVCEPPAIALYYITKLAREHVTVLISGEGGDEAFAGYQNYRNIFWLEAIKSILGPMARPVSALTAVLGLLPGLDRIRKYAPLLNVPFEDYYYSRTADPFQLFNPIKKEIFTPDFQATLRSNARNNGSISGDYLKKAAGFDVLNRMLYVDTKTWLPDDLLIKADKMTMANSLELRVPLLDHRVLEFAAALPRHYKLHGVTTKHILKKALSQRVPAKILERKKTGFPVPYERWIRSEFRDAFSAILTDRKTLQRGYFQKSAVEKMLCANPRGMNYSKEIFSLVVLELWHRTFVDGVPAKLN
jgi:asparagine synthase (glutamine-hydrolysing)